MKDAQTAPPTKKKKKSKKETLCWKSKLLSWSEEVTELYCQFTSVIEGNKLVDNINMEKYADNNVLLTLFLTQW